MIERLTSGLEKRLGWLRIPPPPEPPSGSAASTKTFGPARGFLYRRLIEWALAQAGAIWGIALGLSIPDFLPSRVEEFVGGYIRVAEVLSIALFGLQFFASLAILLLDYRLRWYIVTDRSLRIREGIVRVREQTVSFANIQNVSVKQGPIQRLLGIADVEIRTAGGGEGSSDAGDADRLHQAVFRGVDNAAEIRDLIRNDLRRLRDAEDPPAPEAQARAEPADLLEAARQLADAAGELRATLSERRAAP